MNGFADLFKAETCGAAVTLAALSFVLGMVVMCLVCKLLKPCRCQKKNGDVRQDRRPAAAPVRVEKRHAPPADGSIEIYVGNLSYDLTDDLLRKEFEAYGKVNSARVIINKFNGKSKGFGFVHMPNPAEVEAAVKALNDKELLGRKLKCNVAKNNG